MSVFDSTSLAEAVNIWCSFAIAPAYDTSSATSPGGPLESYGQIQDWDVSMVIDMRSLFFDQGACNPDLSKWDTSKVTSMRSMFMNAVEFNQPINFDTSNVESMEQMFMNAQAFNQAVEFDTSNVKTFARMFAVAAKFNQPVNFDTSSALDMTQMFWNAFEFNLPLNFATQSVTKMDGMFKSLITSFDQDLSSWDTQAVASCDDFCARCGLPVFPSCSPCTSVRTVCGPIEKCDPCQAGSPTARPSLPPPPTPTEPPSTAQQPAAVPGCASNFSIAWRALANSTATLCSPDDPSTLPELPPVDDGGVITETVSPVVEINIYDGEGGAGAVPVQVNGLPPGSITFVIPYLDRDMAERVEVQLAAKGAQCQGTVLQCEWFDTVASSWKTEGCVMAKNLGAEGGMCACQHLTVFMLALRTSRSLDPFCASSAPTVVMACSYLLLLAAAWVQAVRFRRYSLYLKRKVCGVVGVQLVAMSCVAVIRSACLLVLNAITTRWPRLPMLMATLPAVLEQGAFFLLVDLWLRVGLYPMSRSKQRVISRLSVLAFCASCVANFLFPCLLYSVELGSSAFESYVVLGAYAAASIHVMLAGAVGVSGIVLSKALNKASCSSASPGGASKKGQKKGLDARINRSTVMFLVAFTMQAIFLVLSVEEQAIYDEATNLLYPIAFYASDLFCLASLLYMVSGTVSSLSVKASTLRMSSQNSGVEMSKY